MRIGELSLKNIRNVSYLNIEPDEGVNFFVGPNAAGKTSIIEASYFLSHLHSFRTTELERVVNEESDTAEIMAQIQSDSNVEGNLWKSSLKTIFCQSGRGDGRILKKAFINDKLITSRAEYIREKTRRFGNGFHAILFNPSDHELVHGEPRLRRNYLNSVVAAENGDFLLNLRDYQRIVEQRNQVLQSQRGSSIQVLEAFDEAYSSLAVRLTLERLVWLKRAGEKINLALSRIAPSQRPISAYYTCQWLPSEMISLQGTLPSLEQLLQAFFDKYASCKKAEWLRGTTLLGPQRDDWSLCFSSQKLRGSASQGEVRAALLALKLVEIDLYNELTGLKPILLLDDFSSELDEQRRVLLLSLLEELQLQSFVTTTEERQFVGRLFRVRGGAVIDGYGKRDRNTKQRLHC